MKRVLILSQTSVFGGAEVVLTDFLKENTSHDFLIFTSSDNSIIGKYKELLPNAKIITSSTMRFYSMREHPLKAIYELLIRLKKVNQIVKEHKIDILYGNNTADLITVVLYKKIYNRQIKIISHIHDMLDLPVYRKYLRFIRRFDNIVNAYIVPSRAGKKAFAEFVHDENKIHVIHNGVSCEHEKTTLTKEQLKEKYGIPAEKKVMLFVGQISKRKRPDRFIEIVNCINIISGNAYIGIIVGNDKFEYEYASKILTKLNSNFKYIGTLSRADLLREVYPMADVLLLTSERDPLPTVVLEAMASRVLVGANNIDGVPEMVLNTKTGLLFDCDKQSAREIVDSLFRVLSDSNLVDKIKNNAVEYIEREFSDKRKRHEVNRLINAT